MTDSYLKCSNLLQHFECTLSKVNVVKYSKCNINKNFFQTIPAESKFNMIFTQTIVARHLNVLYLSTKYIYLNINNLL